MTTVSPSSALSCWTSSSNPAAMIGSNPAVGSSRNNSSGSITMARASAARLRMPPLSSLGYFAALSRRQPHRSYFQRDNVMNYLGVQPGVLLQRRRHILCERERAEQCALLKHHTEPSMDL